MTIRPMAPCELCLLYLEARTTGYPKLHKAVLRIWSLYITAINGFRRRRL